MLTIWQDEAGNISLLHHTPKLLQRNGEQADIITCSLFPFRPANYAGLTCLRIALEPADDARQAVDAVLGATIAAHAV